MHKLIKISIGVGLTMSVQAATVVPNFQNIYNDNKDVIYLRDDGIVLERIEVEGLSDLAKSDLCEKGISEEVYQKNKTVLRDLDSLKRELIRRCAWERQVRSLERNLNDHLNKATRTKDNKNFGDFDLINDLETIDELLFGTKSVLAEPPFVEADSPISQKLHERSQIGDARQKLVAGPLEVKSSDYQIETVYKVNDGNLDQGEPINGWQEETLSDNSLSAIWDSIKMHLYRLDGRTLAAGCIGNRILQPSILCQYLPNFTTDQSWQLFVPIPPKLTPEFIEHSQIAEEKLAINDSNIKDRFEALEYKIIHHKDCIRQPQLEGNSFREVLGKNIKVCADFEQASLNRELKSIKQGAQLGTEALEWYRLGTTLDYFNSYFEAWLEQVTLFQEFMSTVADKNMVE